MMILKQRFLDDNTKILKSFLNDDTKKVFKGSLIMVPKKFHNNCIKAVLKSSTMMISKSLKRFLNDGIEKVLQRWYQKSYIMILKRFHCDDTKGDDTDDVIILGYLSSSFTKSILNMIKSVFFLNC